MRKAIAMLVWLAAALWVAPAFAAAPPVALAAWVSANTDLPLSQVAIAGADNVYSVEPLGPRLPTGEVLALVRTEAVSAGWRAAHQFLSWDAHLLFDCQGGRVRVLRSASYSEHNRRGTAKPDERGDAWFTPDKDTPAVKLLAAACDAKFDWPLRSTAPPPTPPSPPAPALAPTIQAAAASGAEVAQAAPAPAAQAHADALAAVAPKRAAAAKTVAVAAHDAAALEAGAAKLASAPVAPVVATLQKASFTALPAMAQVSAAPPQAQAAHPRAGVLAPAVSAARTCRRVAAEVRTWIWRRVEVAWTRHGERPASNGSGSGSAAQVAA